MFIPSSYLIGHFYLCYAPPLRLIRLYLHFDAEVPTLLTPAVVGDVGVAQCQALAAVQSRRLTGLDDDITTCDGDGLTWRGSDVTEKLYLISVMLP